MKKNQVLLSILILAANLFNAQDRLRVNNTGVSAPHTTIESALAVADPNDILLLEHSDVPYGTGVVTITEPLVIYGPGYFLAFNDSTQADFRPATINDIVFGPGSEGTRIQGVILGNVTINANNIIVSRCKITGTLSVGQTGNVLNPNINQCFIESGASVLIDVINATNYTLANNLLNNTNPLATNNVRVQTGSGLVLNNLFFGDPDNVLKNATVQNNYFENSEIDQVNSSNLTVDHNMSESLFLDVYLNPTNLTGHPPDTIFCLILAPSPDRKYNLEANVGIADPNPADNAGADGKDIGIYGGSLPYVPSGMPPIPSIWFYGGGSSGTQSGGVTIEIKTKSRN